MPVSEHIPVFSIADTDIVSVLDEDHQVRVPVAKFPLRLILFALNGKSQVVLEKVFLPGIEAKGLALPCIKVDNGKEPLAVALTLAQEIGSPKSDIKFVTSVNALSEKVSSTTLLFFCNHLQVKYESKYAYKSFERPSELVFDGVISDAITIAAFYIIRDKYYSLVSKR